MSVLDPLNLLLKASSKSIVEKCLMLVFTSRYEPKAVSLYDSLRVYSFVTFVVNLDLVFILLCRIVLRLYKDY